MGKGDKKTKRGKIFQGSYGIRRRRKKGIKATIPAVPAKKDKSTTDKKIAREKKEAVKVEPIVEVAEKEVVEKALEIKVPKVVKEKKETKPAAEKKVKKVTKKPDVSTDKAEKKEVKSVKESKPARGKKTK
jgi:30S ribosomal protein S31